MAKVVAVTEAIRSLAEAESRLNLSRAEDETFFTEWQTDLPSLSDSEQTALATLRRRLLYHIADGELLEGAVTLLVASPLLELAGFYDPPFKMKAEAAIKIAIDDGEETLRGRIDVLMKAESALGNGFGVQKNHDFNAIGITSSLGLYDGKSRFG
jgi:hypothetical protein